MSAPSTPRKPRNAALQPGVGSPARPSTPGSRVPKSTAAATASPQIRAALAALRQKRPVASPSLAPAADQLTTPARASTSTQPGATVREAAPPQDALGGDNEEQSAENHDVVLEWNVKDEDKLVEAARKTGRLNLASRGLSSVPPSVYSALLPRSSLYHPSNRNPSHYRRSPQPDLSMAAPADEDDRSAAWYEQQDLRALNLANNEIESVGDELGGFEELEVLDLHNNLLSTIPSSVGYLVNLTSLSLAHNRLAVFPLQVLNLKHLRDLSLAHNQISQLWAADWRAQLDDVLVPPEASPSATPESNSGREAPSFWDSFPSSPIKRAVAVGHGPPSTTAPFPVLTTLSLAGNQLAPDALTAPGFELPPRLVSLDLSACGLTDRALPPLVVGSLSTLKELDLSANDLGDDLFSTTLFPSPASSTAHEPPRLFPSLETLNLSLNPLHSLDSLEAFLYHDVRRPTAYTGLAHVLDNLVHNEERRTGRRIGLPAPAPGAPAAFPVGEPKELSVLVRECPLRLEQARRRARFPAPGTSAVYAAAGAAPAAPSARAEKQVLASGRSASPSPPASPSPAGTAAASPSTPARRRPVVMEDWEVEAAAGLATPGARRRAAALKAQAEREEREQRAARAEEELRRKREAAEEREGARAREEELAKRLEAVKLDERDEKRALARQEEEKAAAATTDEPSDEGSPPPYSPRSPPAAAVASPAPPSAPTPVPAPSHAAPTPSPAREADSTDPAVELVSPAFSRGQTKSTVVLSGRSLSSFPAPTTGAPPAALTSPSHADLSRNVLPTLPLAALAVWGWGASLRVLNLANNRIAALEVLGAGSAGAAPLFPSLDSLDLSSNFLPSTIASPFPSSSSLSHAPGIVVDEAGTVPLLAALAALAPTLSTLSLRGNRLTSLSGIGALLAPSNAVSGSSARGVRRLDLAECRIRAVDDLCAVAERYDADEGGARASWRCDELDLSMNDIASLPPKLGLLPPALVLHLVGNTFRLPRRDVYENAGERLVIPWLRDRL
ncbi:hypothetical protein JCM9279_002654 [Rhodotorula babjevae]